MSFSKILSIGIALSLLLSATPSNDGEFNDNYTNSPITVQNSDNQVITPFDVQLIRPDNYISYNAYEKSFVMDPGNGSNAALWIKNTSADDLGIKVFVNGSNDPLEVSIEKDTQKTISIYVGVTTTYKVYVYSRTGHKIEMSVSARQF